MVLEWKFPKFHGASNGKLILELGAEDPWKKGADSWEESRGG